MIPIKGILENRLFFTFTMLINSSPSLRWRVFFSHYVFLAKQLFVSTLFPLQKWALVSPIWQKYYNIHCQGKLSLDPSNNVIHLSQWWFMRNVKIELHCCYAVEKIINLPWFLWIFVYLICLYIQIVRTFALFEQVQSVIELVMKLKSVRAFREKSTAMSPQQSHAHLT